MRTRITSADRLYFGLFMAIMVMAACLHAESRQMQAFCDFVRFSSEQYSSESGAQEQGTGRLVSLSRMQDVGHPIVYAPEAAGLELSILHEKRMEAEQFLKDWLWPVALAAAAGILALRGAQENGCHFGPEEQEYSAAHRVIIGYMHRTDGEK